MNAMLDGEDCSEFGGCWFGVLVLFPGRLVQRMPKISAH